MMSEGDADWEMDVDPQTVGQHNDAHGKKFPVRSNLPDRHWY